MTRLKKIKVIKNKDGDIYKILQKNNFSSNWNFGELYASKIKTNKIKGWKYHLKQTSCLFVIVGNIKIVTFNEKKNLRYLK